MKKCVVTIAALLLALAVLPAAAQDISVYADSSFQPALRELVPVFSERTGFGVQLTLAPSPILAVQIREGAIPDLFFPAGEPFMKQVMEKGLVDVALKRNILSLPAPQPADPDTPADTQYTSAAVLHDAPHRLQAMAFLEFLASDEARAVFARQGFGLP